MDFPKSVPNVGLVGGVFVDENTVTGQVGSLVPSAWGNAVTQEILAVISAADLVPTEADTDQLLEAIRLLLQADGVGYGADTGAANVYTVAYAPAVPAIVDGMVLRFKAKTANSGASTFSPNGLAAKPIVGLGQAALQGGEIAANGMCIVIWSATLDKWILVASTGGGAEASQIDAEAGTNNTKWMSPLRVFQAIAKVVTQATETVFGWAKVATQAQVNAGTDDATFVTPKKLRFGFSASFTANGWLAFPSWLGGFIVQWGSATGNAGADATLTFPLAWTTGMRSITGTSQGTVSTCIAVVFNATNLTLNSITFRCNTAANASVTNTMYWIAVGS